MATDHLGLKLRAAQTLIRTSVEGGVVRHVAAAVASALFRVVTSRVSDAQIEDETITTSTTADGVEDELDLRLAAIRPVLRA